ncbi:MAG: DNA-directed RNA polymerase subunit B, partial [Nanoarchaeota archaeon]
MVDVFFNGMFSGYVDDAQKFVESVKQTRREGKLSRHLNIRYEVNQDAIYIALDRNRVTRPLIVVKNKMSMLTKDKIDAIKSRSITWNTLVDQGVIEYLDAMEEEDALVALSEDDLTDKHTHMEVNPVTIFGIGTSMVP